MMTPRAHVRRLVERARQQPPLPAAFVYPCDRDALQLALSSAFAGTLAPVLVGPEARVRDVAAHAGLDLAPLAVVDTADDPGAAAQAAVALARERKVSALVRGSLSGDELLGPVAAADSGLRGLARLSHAYFVDLPGRDRGLLLADAQINVSPSLAAKRDIVHNTIGLARALGIAAPAVALLAAKDTVSPTLPSTGDAQALCALAAKGLFGEAIVDGPLTADSALSEAAARANGRESAVAGRADVLIAPGMESGALVLRTLLALTGGLAAGLVLGADVPIVAPARIDSMEVRIASCVLAALLAAYLDATGGRESPAAAPRAPAGVPVTALT